MCEALAITYWRLLRGNHRGNSVERYHCFLNKSHAIAGNDRRTYKVYIQNTSTSQYAWKSSPIDNTDIIRSMVTVGRAFCFPLDLSLSPSPILNTESNSVLLNYLHDISTDGEFSLFVLQIMIEERRSTHCNRKNEGKYLCTLKVGDVVKAHVQVQSRSDTGLVGKLSYRARENYIITKNLGNISFEVQQYDEEGSTTRKYKNTELYLLPPALIPSIILDTIDKCYLDCNKSPIVSPLLRPMRI